MHPADVKCGKLVKRVVIGEANVPRAETAKANCLKPFNVKLLAEIHITNSQNLNPMIFQLLSKIIQIFSTFFRNF